MAEHPALGAERLREIVVQGLGWAGSERRVREVMQEDALAGPACAQ
jgi:uncharacterized protein YneF (UPF0154 family)